MPINKAPGHTMRTGWIKPVTSFMCGAYALTLLLYLASRLLPGERVWWLALIDNFLPWYFLPLLILLPLAALTRARRGLLLMVPVTALALACYAPYFVPKAGAAIDGPRLRVATLNLWGANDALPATYFDGAAAWLRTLDADVILMQELPLAQRTREDGFLGLGALYSHQYALDTDHWTNGAVTRLPVIEQTGEEMTPTAPRYQRLVLDLGGQAVAVYNIHTVVPLRAVSRLTAAFEGFTEGAVFRYDEHIRNRQLDFLVALLAQERLPYIVAGDFNTSDQSLIYPRLASFMRDSFREAGLGLGTSWPAASIRRQVFRFIPPLVRIDYIWHSEDWVATQADQGPALGSDHLALMATVALR